MAALTLDMHPVLSCLHEAMKAAHNTRMSPVKPAKAAHNIASAAFTPAPDRPV